MKKLLPLALIPLAFGMNASAIEPVDGVFKIGSPAELVEFAELVNNGENAANAVLTADIDVSAFPDFGIKGYTGTFDGQLHTLTVNIEANQDDAAAFRNTKGSAVIKNLIVKGAIQTSAKYGGGIVGRAYDNTTIENCETYVTINSLVNGDGTHGGIIGYALGTGNVKVNNCLFAGSINGDQTTCCAGISGWNDVSVSVNNCLIIGDINTRADGSATFARNSGNVKMTNCYYKEGFMEVDDFGKGTKVSADQLANGEITYKLNGNKTDGMWFQNLGEDEFPTLDATHKKVYAMPSNGYRCDGLPMGEVIYTNNEMTANIPPHEFEGGICKSCGEIEPNYLTPVDGIYFLGAANEMAWFAKMLNGNEDKALNAVMTADIDMSAYSGSEFMINVYSGTFDGQGHTLTVNYSINQSNAGLFRETKGDAVVKDLILRGSIETSGKFAGGIVGVAWDNLTIQNCATYVAINSLIVGDGTHGGIVGLLETPSTVNVTNTMFAGSINGEQTNSCGGICGWTGGGSLNVTNCLFIGDITTDLNGCATFARNSGNLRMTNCYYKEGFIELDDPYKATKVTQAEINSGAVAYKLNNGEIDPIKVEWHQNVINEYEPSIPMPTGNDNCGIVYQLSNGSYMAVYDNESMQTFQNIFLSQETDYLKNVRANVEVIEAYESILEDMTGIDNYEAFWTEFVNIQTKKQALIDNVNSYNDYFSTVADVQAYLEENELSGTSANLLRSYVTDYIEPDETFANGSATYIEEELPLSTEQVMNEIDFLKNLWDQVVKEDYLPGTDITMRLANGDFSNGWNGWDGNGGTSTASSLNPAVREAWNGTMDRHQTITGLKNGVYEVQLNGLFRPAGDDHSTNYAAYLTANSGETQNWVPFMAISEDALPVSKAVDMENSYIGDVNTHPYDNEFLFEDFGEFFYVPNSVDGASYAFKGGRYLNRILVNVTDGSLTLGVFVPGTGGSNDWAPFGGTKLIYQGELESETATASLNAVLEGMAARAQTLIGYKANASDYLAYTGFSQVEKEELQACIDGIASAGSNAEKNALVERFSKVFQSIKDTKDAYKYMIQESNIYMDVVANLAEIGGFSDEELRAIVTAYEAIDKGFENGVYTAQEAREMKMFEGLNLVPAQDENGVYQIGTISEFAFFSQLVHNHNSNLNAKQTADIEGINFDMALTDFRGTYDGDFHAMTLNIETDQEQAAPFRSTRGDAIIKNLILKGTIQTSNKYAGGIVGRAWDNLTIQNCVTYVAINSLVSGDGTHGGIVGLLETPSTVNVTNTMFAGSINGEQTNGCGGICGWTGGGSLIVDNCLFIGDITTDLSGCATFARNSGNLRMTNSYYKDGFIEVDDYGKGKKATADQLASGEVTYKLNGNKAEGGWYQTLNEDSTPTPITTSKKVYATPSDGFRCDGTPLGEITYTNEEGTVTLPDHKYEGFTCQVCGQIDPDYVTPENGVYPLGTTDELAWFSLMVNTGNTNINAKLTADIDMSAYPDYGVKDYTGTFDGQFHTLTLNINSTQDDAAAFRNTKGNAVIKNLIVKGNIQTSAKYGGGIVGRAYDNTTIEDCETYVVINSLVNGDGTHGGIIGYALGSGNVTVNNCLFAGSINGDQTTCCAGISGWNDVRVSVKNCLLIGDINVKADGSATFARNSGNVNVTNTYYKDGFMEIDDFGKGTKVSADQLASGEVCYLLNRDQSEVVWYQTLGEDPFPILNASHMTVIKNDDGSYGNITGIDKVQNAESIVQSGVYDLSGRKVSMDKLSKGIYIINGKKVLVK